MVKTIYDMNVGISAFVMIVKYIKNSYIKNVKGAQLESIYLFNIIYSIKFSEV